jgi:hypothetical protein
VKKGFAGIIIIYTRKMVAKFLIVRNVFIKAPRSEEDEESEDKKKNRGKEASEDEGDKKKKKRDDKKESSIYIYTSFK